MDSNLLLKVSNLGLTYKRATLCGLKDYYCVLENINFSMYRGESLAVIGRNGAGKSSLLKLIAGVMSPTIGEIEKRDNTSITLLSLHAGFEQNLSGYINIFLQGMLLGLSRKYIKSKVSEIIDFSELGEFIHKPVRDYSSGMAARLGFAIAIQLKPDLLLIDEIISVGDVSFQEKSLKIMHEKLQSEQSIILVSHDANLVRNLCCKALWIEDGQCKAFGPATDVVEYYEEYMRNETIRS